MSNNLDYKKDPNGIIKRDIAILEAEFPNRPITPKNTLAEIQFQAGQQSVIRYIKEQLLGSDVRETFTTNRQLAGLNSLPTKR